MGSALAAALGEAGVRVSGPFGRGERPESCDAVLLGMRPFELDDSRRAAYHAAASIASNFLVTLEAAAESMASSAGIAPEEARALLGPLVRSTVENWIALGPEGALTGPVARGDE